MNTAFFVITAPAGILRNVASLAPACTSRTAGVYLFSSISHRRQRRLPLLIVWISFYILAPTDVFSHSAICTVASIVVTLGASLASCRAGSRASRFQANFLSLPSSISLGLAC